MRPVVWPPQYAPAPDLDRLTLKVVSESRVTWATSVPILVFLGLSVLDLGPMYSTDRQTDRRQTRIIAYLPVGAGHNNNNNNKLINKRVNRLIKNLDVDTYNCMTGTDSFLFSFYCYNFIRT